MKKNIIVVSKEEVYDFSKQTEDNVILWHSQNKLCFRVIYN